MQYNWADYIERRRPMIARWSDRIQEAARGNLSVSAMTENQDRKIVSIL
ncbi:integrase [Pseudomonas reinekei]|uniref:Integrase n=1 Tax=Pseudomonas reinekei TaxID=395598 RepID=A0A6H9RJE1_PSERE|nr:integrase [Pseudomonas reinekei]